MLCSGKLCYDLETGREEKGVDDVAIIRTEQFYPFNRELLESIAAPYLGATDVVWAQEETANRGGWSFIMPRLQEVFPDHPIRYVGRGASASPATGSLKVHRRQQQAIVDGCLDDE